VRKIILFIATSLDGYIARENGDIDWLFSDQDYGYHKFYDSIDTVLLGGKTFRQVMGFGGDFPYATKNCYVFTHDVSNESNDEVTFIHHNVADFVSDLKNENGKDIWLIGGSQINTILLNEGLIDEMRIFMHPVILGSGIPLFQQVALESWFKIHDVEEFESGLIQLTYNRKD
jgi:dihydrofolate reductase